MPETLSGGEVQRTAIARALVTQPGLLVADEPTGMLDGATSAAVISELTSVASETGTALLIVTHDPDIAATADVQARLRDARLTVERSVATDRSDPARC
jgi:ABC-type lipoprotein export system ATPase subunit